MSDYELRTLPQNLDAEKAVLGAIIVHNHLLLQAQHILTASDFFRRAHQQLFDACVTLSDQKVGIDLVTLTNEVARRGQEAEVGGPAYISQLTDGVPRSTNVEYYARIVREHSVRRQIIQTSSKLVDEAYQGEATAEEMLANADRGVLELQRSAVVDRTADIRVTSQRLLEDLEYRSTHRNELRGVDTGFKYINDLTNGWQAGDMIIVGARPSIGKTAWMLNSVVGAARSGTSVLLFSLEMRRQQLEYRMLSALSGVPLTNILSGWLGDMDFERINPAWNEMHTLPIFIDDRSGQTSKTIRASARRYRTEHKVGLIVIDYAQLVTGTLEGRHTRTEQLTDFSRNMKVLADDVSCPIIVLSQLNRKGEDRNDKRPIMSDLRETGAFEQDADLVAFLHRKDHKDSGLTFFYLEKQRNGPTGEVNLSIQRETQQFTEHAPTPAPQPLVPDAVPDERKKRRFGPRRS